MEFRLQTPMWSRGHSFRWTADWPGTWPPWSCPSPPTVLNSLPVTAFCLFQWEAVCKAELGDGFDFPSSLLSETLGSAQVRSQAVQVVLVKQVNLAKGSAISFDNVVEFQRCFLIAVNGHNNLCRIL